jgi:hypothetical protein
MNYFPSISHIFPINFPYISHKSPYFPYISHDEASPMTMGHAGGLSSAGLGAVGWSGRGLVPRNWGYGGENNRGSDVYCKVYIYIYIQNYIIL